MEKHLDLHIHSTISDGKYTGIEIIDMAKKNNVEKIAIADHDILEVYSKELFEYAKEKEIEIVPAVEISTKLNKTSIHILGYNIDLNNQKLIEELKNVREERQVYLLEVSKKINELGYHINLEKLSMIDGVTKAHISEDIVKNIKNHDLLIKNYGYIPSKGEFIETIMNPGCKAFVLRKTFTPKQASELIKQANGDVVLAHPVVYKNKDNLGVEEIKSIIKDINADGIESRYIYVNKNNEVINEISLWDEIAKQLNIYTTIGSDFHNFDGISPEIGFVNYRDIINNVN